MKPLLFVLLMGVVNSVHTIAQSVNNQFPDSLTVNSSRPFHLKAQDYVAKLAMQSPQDSSEGGYLHSLTRHIDYVNNRISSNAPIGTPPFTGMEQSLQPVCCQQAVVLPTSEYFFSGKLAVSWALCK
ncbi:MAG: hypothetical protein JST88_03830 [Bacteroidetes bacterium]|nr:hypothetical protein [Bacteroidota bacterium]